MVNKFIAINGDDVGQRIGNAIASDDHDTLQEASSSIQSGHSMIEEWVEARGGRIVTSSGDDGIYEIPETVVQELESIRQSYQKMTGHTLTAGIGDSMSEASKALIYGKLNEKDQVVEYEPSIDDYISDTDMEDDEESNQAAQISDEEMTPEEGELPTDQEAEMQTEDANAIDAGIEEPKDSFQPEHEEGMDPSEEMVHDAAEQQADEDDADNIEADMEAQGAGLDGEVEGEDLGVDETDIEGGDPEVMPPEMSQEIPSEEMGQGMPSEMPQEEMGQEESPFDGIAPDTEEPQEDFPTGDIDGRDAIDAADKDNDGDIDGRDAIDAADKEEEYDHNDALTDMVYGNMEEDGEEIPEGSEDADMEEELKSDISNALLAFRDNKDILEAAREQSPELYTAVITMLSSMIDMAHKLGFSADKEIESQDAETDMMEEFPDQEQEQEVDQEQEQEMDQEQEERNMPETQEESEDLDPEEDPKKKAQFQ